MERISFGYQYEAGKVLGYTCVKTKEGHDGCSARDLGERKQRKSACTRLTRIDHSASFQRKSSIPLGLVAALITTTPLHPGRFEMGQTEAVQESEVPDDRPQSEDLLVEVDGVDYSSPSVSAQSPGYQVYFKLRKMRFCRPP